MSHGQNSVYGDDVGVIWDPHSRAIKLFQFEPSSYDIDVRHAAGIRQREEEGGRERFREGGRAKERERGGRRARKRKRKT